MSKDQLVVCLILAILIMGIYTLFIRKEKIIKLGASVSDRIKNLIDKKIEKDIKLDSKELSEYYDYIRKYNRVRTFMVIIVAGVISVKVTLNQYDFFEIGFEILFLLVISVVTLPVKKIGKHNTFFDLFLRKISISKMMKLDTELYASSMILKNFAVLSKYNDISTDYILQQLFEQSDKMKVYYGRMLSLYRQGKSEAAFDDLSKTINTKASTSFSLILSKLDYIKPDELISQIDTFQSIIIEEKYTAEIKGIDKRSLGLTVVSTAAMFALLLDFMIVVVFMDTIAMLDNFF